MFFCLDFHLRTSCGLPSDLGTLTSPGIGSSLTVNSSLLLSESLVGPVHGVFVLSGDGSLIAIVVWDLFGEHDEGILLVKLKDAGSSDIWVFGDVGLTVIHDGSLSGWASWKAISIPWLGKLDVLNGGDKCSNSEKYKIKK